MYFFNRQGTNWFLVFALALFVGCGGKEDAKVVQPAGGAAATGTTGGTAKGTDVNPGISVPGIDDEPTPAVDNTSDSSSKVDPAVQQRVAAMGAQIKTQSEKRAAGAAELTGLREIGLSIHSYYDAQQSLPAVNGSGLKDAKYPGLSWRVYLLPYLEQNNLFEQFKLDEPWDSEHNKALISKMPSQFGKNEEGKTRIHALSGAGTAFAENAGAKLFDATDGMSNTLMVVEGGADTADFWTKPGGLAFDVNEPLKCLGQLDDEFKVLMMDGFARRLSKNVDPATFAKLAQKADGQPVSLDSVEIAAKESAPKIKVNPPITPLAPTSKQLDLSFIPQEAFAAAIVHPRRIFEHAVVKKTRDLYFPSGLGLSGDRMATDLDMVLERSEEMSGALGLAPQNVDEIVVLLHKDVVQAAMQGPQNGIPPIGVVIRNSAPIEIEPVVHALSEKSSVTEIQDFEGVSLIVSVHEKAAIAFINDSTLIGGQLDFVKSMIKAKDQGGTGSGLLKRLSGAGNRHIVLAVDAVPVEPTVKLLSAELPGPLALFSAYITGAKELLLTADLDDAEMVRLDLEFKSPQLAMGLFGVVDAQFQQAKEQAPQWRSMIEADPAGKGFLPTFDQLVAEAKLVNSENTISVTIPRLKDLEKIPELLKPAVDQAKKATEQVNRRNNLKMIGLAFHNYESAMRAFPAANGPGAEPLPHPGLSWRVYLLPYLDESGLYQEFKLDEPWDSDHNKALIARMPKVFGTNPEGKTSIHIFAGKGAPFQDNVGLKISDITDGTSNTILAIEAGEDVADIWTKPGGLAFDADMPLKSIGNVKEFNILMMDGSVRLLRNINAELFGRLIQHQDGGTIELE